MVSVRFASVIFLAAFMASSTVQSATMNNKPYSPDLYARDALMAESDSTESSIGLMKRVQIAKPYAPDLFSRQSLEDEEDESEIEQERRSTVIKRSISPAATATWSLFKRAANEESEEDLHARGLIDDAQIEARGHCSNDSQCGSDRYCSSKRQKCYKKINDYHTCSRNEACGSGYCCESDNLCKPPRDNGAKCHGNDNACDSGYCSVVSDKCRPQASKGDGCRVDQGCKGSLSCVNGTCKHSGSSQPSKPHHPNHPAPSGSARQRRTLTSL